MQGALPLPATLTHDAPSEFEVSFRPDHPTFFAGEVAIEYRLDTGPGVFVATMSGRGVLSAPQADEFEQPARLKVDLLWVINDGMSMALELPSVRQGLDAIYAAFDEPLASGANRAFYHQGAVLNVIVPASP